MKQPRTRLEPGPTSLWVVLTCPVAPPPSVTQSGVGIPGPSLPGWNTVLSAPTFRIQLWVLYELTSL
jgi:hypothetical protein